jgi:hypothetical protein
MSYRKLSRASRNGGGLLARINIDNFDSYRKIAVCAIMESSSLHTAISDA